MLRVEVQHLEMEGLEKIESAVVGSEAEGLYRLLGGAISYTHIHHSTPIQESLPHPICHHPQTTPSGAWGSCTQSFCSCGRSYRTGIRSCHSSCVSSSRGGYPHPYDTPLPTVGGIKRVYKYKVEGCMEGPSTSHAAICTHACREHLGWGSHVPPLTKLSSTQTSSGITRKVTFLSRFLVVHHF